MNLHTIPKRIVAFGSSSVHGTGDSESGGFINRFRLWHESENPKNKVYNLGIWGETTDQLIARIVDEAVARRPHLILIYPGFNDIRREGSSESPNSIDDSRASFPSAVSCTVCCNDWLSV